MSQNNELQQTKLLYEKTRLINEQLNSKKLKQETHWIKNWIIPAIQVLGALFLVFVTYIIGSNTNLLKSQSTVNDLKQANIENTRVLNNIEEALKSIQYERANYNLEKQTDSLNNKKSLLSKQNQSLGVLNHSLDNVNIRLRGAIFNSKNQNEELLSERKSLDVKLHLLRKNLDSLRNVNEFAAIDFDLHSIKTAPNLDQKSTYALIAVLQTNQKFAQRVADSLVYFKSLNIPHLWGLCDYIIYFATGDVRFKEELQAELKNNFDLSDKSKVNFDQILYSIDWSDTDRVEFSQILMSLLPTNVDIKHKIFILVQIARLQNWKQNFDLAKQDFNSYITYLHYCRILTVKNFYDNQEDYDNNNRIIDCLAIMCPQVYVCQKITILNEAIRLAKSKIDTNEAKKINPHYVTFDESTLQDKITDKLQKLFLALGTNNDAQGKTYTSVINKNLKIFKFWSDFYNEKYNINKETIKSKILNVEF